MTTATKTNKCYRQVANKFLAKVTQTILSKKTSQVFSVLLFNVWSQSVESSTDIAVKNKWHLNWSDQLCFCFEDTLQLILTMILFDHIYTQDQRIMIACSWFVKVMLTTRINKDFLDANSLCMGTFGLTITSWNMEVNIHQY